MNLLRPISIPLFLGLVLTSSLTLAQQVPDQLIELKADGARVFAAARSQALTGPAASPAAAVRSFLTARGKSARALDSLVLVSESNAGASGVTHLRYGQAVNGLDVYGTYVKASVNSRRELIHLIEILPEPPVQLVQSNVSARAALDAALRELYPGLAFSFTELPVEGSTTEFDSGDTFFYRNPTSTRVALPLSTGAMHEGWLVETWTRTDNQLHHTIVGNGARVLATEDRTANETYRVFTEHPQITLNGTIRGAAQADVSGPGTGSSESQRGWISDDGRTDGKQSEFRLSGNNVDAYLDADANNSPDSAGNTVTDFLGIANPSDSPTTAANRRVAIQNLFWASNIIHDQLYKNGFIESAGNFQQNNFSGGGYGNDSLLAEAQDGSGTNNANFSTPADGSSPRMQMFLWTATSPNRDGDVDTDVVYHEYGHGLTWRMIGSMSGCMSGAVGEGASDTLSILMNQDDVVGEYSYNNSNGIRRWPYTNYPRTYGNLTNEAVHAAGELFGAIMWRAKSYLNNDTSTWKYLVGGMDYIPAGPKFEHMRDGIVQAAGGLSGDGCLIYRAFADFGVGEGASGSCTTKGVFYPTTTWNVSESFAVPTACLSPVTDIAVTAVNAPASVTPGSTSNVVVTVKNVGNQNVGSFSVTLSGTDGTNMIGVSVAGLVAGASADRTFSWTAPSTSASVTLTGRHTFTDDSGANNSLSKPVSVVAAQALSLTVTTRVVKGKKYADLRWTPTGTGEVDISKNSAFLASTPNNGFYTDGPQAKTTKTATYKVCAYTNCSNAVTVSF